MAWDHLSINRPHLVYVILGGFTSLFMLCSSIIKERLYIGEATVATICGIIFGPHAANLIDPASWGNVDQITLEFSRIVLVVQCFAVGVELPRSYMERHWKSVTLLLIPVMTFGWLITSLFIWWMFKGWLNWLDSLCIAACVTATDPVLASSVVGKGKFAKRVPKHLRDLLSAESGCNDGMAFPFVYLAIYTIRYKQYSEKVAFHWFCYTVLYECIFGAIYGVAIGYAARRAVRYSHEKDLIDRESFLVFYFVLALFCAGSGSILGLDDLLVGFAAGVGFSNDGWFLEKTEESHVSNVIDLLINLSFFVYFGSIIPWKTFNAPEIIGTSPWRLVVVGLLVLFFRRIPIMLVLKPVIPDVKTWREALFAGHFGPIGVGGLFVAILARAELETGSTTPLAELPPKGFPHLNIIELIWPITTFLVITSIVVHGSSIAVFTLGKHINTLTISLSYTQANEEGPSWMDRLPRIQSRSKSSMSMRRPDETDSSLEEKAEYAEGAVPRDFLRRQKPEEAGSRASSLKPPFRRRRWDAGRGPGGPISQSAITPQARSVDHSNIPASAQGGDVIMGVGSESTEKDADDTVSVEEPQEEVYREGDKDIIEDEEGNVLEVRDSKGESKAEREMHELEEGRKLMEEKEIKHGVAQTEHEHPPLEETGVPRQAANDPAPAHGRNWKDMGKKMNVFGGLTKRDDAGQSSKPPQQKRGPALAYQFGNTIIVEDEDGEVIKKYDIPSEKGLRPHLERKGSTMEQRTRVRLHRMGTYMGLGKEEDAGPTEQKNKRDYDDDDRIRFTVTAGGRRMSKAEFIQQIQKMDPRARAKLVEDSNVPQEVKDEAKRDAEEFEANDQKANARGEVPPKDGYPSGQSDAAVQQRDSSADSQSGPEGLQLVDSNGDAIPFHPVSEDLQRHSRAKETAADRRRRLAAQEGEQRAHNSQSQSSGQVEGSSLRQATLSELDEGETAAERRRRELALGIVKDEGSDSEEDDDETVLREPSPARTTGIRFAEDPRPGGNGTRLRWVEGVKEAQKR